MSAPQWFEDRIRSGLQRLYTLSLPGSPAADVLAATADTWIAVLWPPGMWQCERDLPRFNEAFRLLAGKVDRWPPPSALRECLPPAPEVKALPPPPYRASPDRIARARAVVAELAQRWTTEPKDRP